MASIGIHTRTKVGAEVFDGGARFVVAHRVQDTLVLREVRSGDFYTRHIEGGGRRHLSEQDAINAAVLPVVGAQIALQRAATIGG